MKTKTGGRAVDLSSEGTFCPPCQIVHGFLPMGRFAELPVFPSIQIYIGLLKDNKDNTEHRKVSSF